MAGQGFGEERIMVKNMSLEMERMGKPEGKMAKKKLPMAENLRSK